MKQNSPINPKKMGIVQSDNAKTVRIMLVDDSLTARNVFVKLLEDDPRFEVVGQASSAERALELLAKVQADLILLDLEMPGKGGLAALPEILEAGQGAKILIVSAVSRRGAEQTLKALSIGASDTVFKPEAGVLDDKFREELKRKIRILGARRLRSSKPVDENVALKPVPRRIGHASEQLLAIGGSTGGIDALCKLLKKLPAVCGMPILVTQHLPIEFIEVFARQISEASRREVEIARPGLALKPDKVVIAPGDAHLIVKRAAGQLTVDLKHGRSESGYLPSVDVMFDSLAGSVGSGTIAVVLSGMGKDGLVGAKAIAAVGGTILAQDEDSSSVWGMPRAVIEGGLASYVLSPENLADRITSKVRLVA